jgi:hypothetical protein
MIREGLDQRKLFFINQEKVEYKAERVMVFCGNVNYKITNESIRGRHRSE